MNLKKQKGFTLIELLVVIAIVGILASIVLSSLWKARKKARIASVKSSMTSMRSRAELAVTSSDKYPNTLCTDGLRDLVEAVRDIALTNQPIICRVDQGNGLSWVAIAKLDQQIFFCVDSTGYAGEQNQGITDMATDCKTN